MDDPNVPLEDQALIVSSVANSREGNVTEESSTGPDFRHFSVLWLQIDRSLYRAPFGRIVGLNCEACRIEVKSGDLDVERIVVHSIQIYFD